MPRKKETLFDFLDEPNIQIMKNLRNSQLGYTDLMKLAPVSPGAFNKRLNDLINLGLVKARYNERERRPLYMLTPTGKRILELLEEIERVYREEIEEYQTSSK